MDKGLLEKVDNFSEFLFVDELDKQLLSSVSKKNILNLGKSANGHQILCAKIGKGGKNALIFGFPHPNEPVGSLTCISLIKILLKNKELQEKYTWYIIPCADPDGAKLNEGWFKGKFTIKKYIYNFYRSQSRKQVEWTFPVKYKKYKFSKPIKPTRILMKLIDKIKPSLNYPLHDSGFGGAYFYLTKEMPSKYYDEIIRLCKKLSVPLHLGEPELEFVKELTKPFNLIFALKEQYDFFSKTVKKPWKIFSCGTSSTDYAMKKNQKLFGLVGEVPYIYDSQIFNKKRLKESRRYFLKEKYAVKSKIFNFIEQNIKQKGINTKSIFYSVLRDVLKMEKSILSVLERNVNKKKYSKKATVAEEFDSLVVQRFYSVRLLGEFRRLLLESGKNKQVKELIKKTKEQIDEHTDYIEKHSNYRALPIKKLVQLQLGCLLISLDYL